MKIITFKEMAKLGAEVLAKQPPVTLEEAREQCLRIKIRSNSVHKGQKETKDEQIKYLLNKYHPDWTQEQINVELIRLYEKYGKEKEGEK